MTGDRGLTLVELLVAFTIAGLIAAVVTASVSTALRRLDARNAETAAASELRRLRSLAQESGQAQRFDPAMLRLPDGYSLTTQPADGVRFYPDGTSSGGRVAIGDGALSVVLDVDWINGRVRRAE